MSSGRGTRDAILEAARARIERDGAGAVRLADVARDAGVSRQAVYLHFGSRAGLLVALVSHLDAQAGVAEAAQRWRAEGLTATARLDAFLAWWSGYVPRIRGVANALLAERAADAAADAAWRDRMRVLQRATRYVVDQLAKEDALAPIWEPADAADWLWALVSVQLRETLAERGWSNRRYAGALREVVHRALLA